MAPEIIRAGGAGYEGQMADLWSSGVMLYAMLFGNYPFGGLNVRHVGPANTLKIINAILTGVWSVPEGASISQGCLRVLQRLLVLNPQERMKMEDLMNDEWFLVDLPPETSKMNESFLEESRHLEDKDPGDEQIKLMLLDAMEKQRKIWEVSMKDVMMEVINLLDL